MIDIIIDALRASFGVAFGSMALVFAFVSVRLVVSGRDAYNTNRAITPKNIFKVWSGHLRDDVKDIEGRASHGVAINLKSGMLEEQRRLSTEAVDDVIGRRAL